MVAKQSIRLAISGVLKEYGIDDLEIEGRLATAVYGFFHRLESGENEKLVEADMLSTFERNHAEIRYRAELVERINKALRLNLDSDQLEKDGVLKFIERMERDKGQRIETFAQWCRDDPFNSPKAHQIAKSPLEIKKTWPQAFPADEPQQLTFVKSGGGVDF